MSSIIDNNFTAREQSLRDWIAILFLVDVVLMFSGLFFLDATSWWLWLPFHLIACSYTLFVIYLAYKAMPHVPASIPSQRPIGVLLYLSCHAIQFFVPGQIPIAMVGYLMLAGPLSLIFLFDQLNAG